MAPPAGIISETARYSLALYILVTTGMAFYIIFAATQTNFINDNGWADRHNLTAKPGDKESEIMKLRTARNAYYYFAIALVIANFLMFLYLFGTKFTLASRY